MISLLKILNELEINKPTPSLKYDDLIKYLYKVFEEDPGYFNDMGMFSKEDIYEGFKGGYIVSEIIAVDDEEGRNVLKKFYSKYKKIIVDGIDYTNLIIIYPNKF